MAMKSKTKKRGKSARAKKQPEAVDEMAKYRKRFEWDSKKKQLVEISKPVRVYAHARWPIHSDAMAVHPKQAQQLREYLESKGVPTEIDKDGCPVLTGPEHRKRVAEARGFFDRNGGYSDPQRR